MGNVENTLSAAGAAVCAAGLQTTVNYGRALRAIGQDLTELYPRTLEITFDGMNFVAAGQSHPDPFATRRKTARLWLWRKLLGKNIEAAAAAVPLAGLCFERIYGVADIDRLDSLFGASRTGQLERPDSYSLAERLRTMGNIVDQRRGRLKSIRKNADQLFADYWDSNGEIKTAKLTTVILYRNAQTQLAPGTAPRELWEGYDF